MPHFLVSVPATIDVVIEADDADSITGDMVFDATGKYPQLKAGTNFDPNEFTLLTELEEEYVP